MIEYVVSSLMEDLEERRYRAYITDALMILTENTAKYAGGKALTVRWFDKFKPVDNRTGDEIILDVIRNAGLTVKGGGPNGFTVFDGKTNAGQ